MRLFALLLVAGCSPTLHAKDYAADCDADLQCAVIVVGDLCSCDCELAAINERDYDKYTNDIIATGGCRNPPVCQCGTGIGAQCVASQCQTVELPAADAGDASAE